MNNAAFGAIAGAVGTIALDITSYGDMALRGRPASNLPAEIIRRTAEKARVEPLAVPDEVADDSTKNRRRALGMISGHAIGIGAGTLCGAMRSIIGPVPAPVMALVMGGVAMAAADVPATTLNITDPRRWGVSGWLSDIVPHLAYGLVAAGVFAALVNDGERS